MELKREMQTLKGLRSLMREIFVEFYYSQELIVNHCFNDKILPMIAP